jgi:cytochrome P450
MDEDSVINVGNGKKVFLKKGAPYCINIRAIHHDPQ